MSVFLSSVCQQNNWSKSGGLGWSEGGQRGGQMADFFFFIYLNLLFCYSLFFIFLFFYFFLFLYFFISFIFLFFLFLNFFIFYFFIFEFFIFWFYFTLNFSFLIPTKTGNRIISICVHNDKLPVIFVSRTLTGIEVGCIYLFFSFFYFFIFDF